MPPVLGPRASRSFSIVCGIRGQSDKASDWILWLIGTVVEDKRLIIWHDRWFDVHQPETRDLEICDGTRSAADDERGVGASFPSHHDSARARHNSYLASNSSMDI